MPRYFTVNTPRIESFYEVYDWRNRVFQALNAQHTRSLKTTDNSSIAIFSTDVAENEVVALEATVVARQTGGSAGAVNNAGGWWLPACAVFMGANPEFLPDGNAGFSLDFYHAARDVDAWLAEWDIVDDRIGLFVEGANNMDINWSAFIRTIRIP